MLDFFCMETHISVWIRALKNMLWRFYTKEIWNGKSASCVNINNDERFFYIRKYANEKVGLLNCFAHGPFLISVYTVKSVLAGLCLFLWIMLLEEVDKSTLHGKLIKYCNSSQKNLTDFSVIGCSHVWGWTKTVTAPISTDFLLSNLRCKFCSTACFFMSLIYTVFVL